MVSNEKESIYRRAIAMNNASTCRSWISTMGATFFFVLSLLPLINILVDVGSGWSMHFRMSVVEDFSHCLILLSPWCFTIGLLLVLQGRWKWLSLIFLIVSILFSVFFWFVDTLFKHGDGASHIVSLVRKGSNTYIGMVTTSARSQPVVDVFRQMDIGGSLYFSKHLHRYGGYSCVVLRLMDEKLVVDLGGTQAFIEL